jgi:hypothetical protein
MTDIKKVRALEIIGREPDAQNVGVVLILLAAQNHHAKNN